MRPSKSLGSTAQPWNDGPVRTATRRETPCRPRVRHGRQIQATGSGREPVPSPRGGRRAVGGTLRNSPTKIRPPTLNVRTRGAAWVGSVRVFPRRTEPTTGTPRDRSRWVYGSPARSLPCRTGFCRERTCPSRFNHRSGRRRPVDEAVARADRHASPAVRPRARLLPRPGPKRRPHGKGRTPSRLPIRRAVKNRRGRVPWRGGGSPERRDADVAAGRKGPEQPIRRALGGRSNPAE